MSAGVLDQDFDRLEIGSRFETGGRTITEDDIVSFAELTCDRHPQHTDAAWASESAFGERIAHGTLLISLAFGMLPVEPERVLALRSIRDAVFKRPAPIGTTIRVGVEVTDLRALDQSRGLVTFAVRIRDDGGKLLVRLIVEGLWRRT